MLSGQFLNYLLFIIVKIRLGCIALNITVTFKPISILKQYPYLPLILIFLSCTQSAGNWRLPPTSATPISFRLEPWSSFAAPVHSCGLWARPLGWWPGRSPFGKPRVSWDCARSFWGERRDHLTGQSKSSHGHRSRNVSQAWNYIIESQSSESPKSQSLANLERFYQNFA